MGLWPSPSSCLSPGIIPSLECFPASLHGVEDFPSFLLFRSLWISPVCSGDNVCCPSLLRLRLLLCEGNGKVLTELCAPGTVSAVLLPLFSTLVETFSRLCQFFFCDHLVIVTEQKSVRTCRSPVFALTVSHQYTFSLYQFVSHPV